jgi:hypothetical protein
VLAAAPELAELVSRVLAERQAALSKMATETVEQHRASVEAQSSVLLGRIKRFFGL